MVRCPYIYFQDSTVQMLNKSFPKFSDSEGKSETGTVGWKQRIDFKYSRCQLDLEIRGNSLQEDKYIQDTDI